MDPRAASPGGSSGEPDVVPVGGMPARNPSIGRTTTARSGPPTAGSIATPHAFSPRVFLSRLRIAFQTFTIPDRDFGR